MISKNSEENAQSARPDAFQKYSNDVTRLKKLLLKEDDDEFDVHDFARRHYVTDAAVNLAGSSREVPTRLEGSAIDQDQGGKEEQVADRKTRISFELHPALLMDEILADVYGPDDAQDGSDIVDILSLFDNRETARQ